MSDPAPHLDEVTASSFAAGQLTPTERAVALEHISDCASCRKLVASLSRQHQALEEPETHATRGSVRTVRDAPVPIPLVLPADRLIGVKLGEYTVESLISRGGMGAVYRAVNPVINRAVAIKVLLPHVADDPEQMHRLLTEARAVADIKHPNIVDIYGFGETPDHRHYFVMELLDGEPLSALLGRRGKLAPMLALELLDQLLSALEAAHARGVVHRDLKPHNLIINARPDSSHRLTVLDFGLAKRMGERSHTAPDLVLGTPGYMSPEQISGEPIGPRADLYSVGALAYRMFTGQDAYAGPNVVGVMRAQIEEAPPRVASRVPVPAALDHLVYSLLSRDPNRRPSSARETLDALRMISFNWVDAKTINEPRPGDRASLTTEQGVATPLPKLSQAELERRGFSVPGDDKTAVPTDRVNAVERAQPATDRVAPVATAVKAALADGEIAPTTKSPSRQSGKHVSRPPGVVAGGAAARPALGEGPGMMTKLQPLEPSLPTPKVPMTPPQPPAVGMQTKVAPPEAVVPSTFVGPTPVGMKTVIDPPVVARTVIGAPPAVKQPSRPPKSATPPKQGGGKAVTVLIILAVLVALAAAAWVLIPR